MTREVRLELADGRVYCLWTTADPLPAVMRIPVPDYETGGFGAIDTVLTGARDSVGRFVYRQGGAQ